MLLRAPGKGLISGRTGADHRTERSDRLILETKDRQIIAGALLHDVGKILFRCDYYGNISHPESGFRFLREEAGITDSEILDCVRYHHADAIKGAGIPQESPAYIVHAADNIASAADRRESGGSVDGKTSPKDQPLESVFNILNGKREKLYYTARFLNQEGEEDSVPGINFPVKKEKAKENKNPADFYRECAERIKNEIRSMEADGSIDGRYLDPLLCSLETTCSFIPSSTYKGEIQDISLYDHSKITAAVSSCIWQYLKEQKCTDFREKLFTGAKAFCEEKAFLLYSMDISGIQKFIYTISSDGALRSLRARSFYLDALMEHTVDELLASLSLTRANLIYSGGGHCYLLLPNTAEAKEKAAEHEKELNAWFIRNFGNALYIAGGFAECAANDLSNANGKDLGRFPALFRSVSEKLSAKKAHRYTKEEILTLNSLKTAGERECRMCRRVDNVNSDGLCPICNALLESSKHILRDRFFAVINAESSGEKKVRDALPLPFGCELIGVPDEGAARKLLESSSCRRLYSKNAGSTGKLMSTHLWVSDYSYTPDLGEYASMADGIKRLGIMRCDIDNLGTAFVKGFDRRCNTLSRMAMFSRQLSLFFKVCIDSIFRKNSSKNFSLSEQCRVSTVYSGGDDVFIIGSWGDVIDAAVMLREEFRKFCEGTLTISSGIGIYPEKFPVSVMASETEELVDCAKDLPGTKALPEKDGITLFESSSCFKWDNFTKNVIDEKFRLLEKFFDSRIREGDGNWAEFGKAFLYRLLTLLRAADGKGSKLNRARLAYMLSRLEPGENAESKEKQTYRELAGSVYRWYGDMKERKELEAAIGLYAYSVRDRRNQDDNPGELRKVDELYAYSVRDRRNQEEKN